MRLPKALPAIRRVAIVLALGAFSAASVCAQTKPNFSGTWKELQPSSPGYSHIEIIDQQGPSLKVVIETHSTGGRLGTGLYMDHTYTIGGKEEVKKGDDGIIRSVSVKWEGTGLAFLRTEKEGANTTTTHEVWSVSDDSKILTKARHITDWRGSKEEKILFEKQ